MCGIVGIISSKTIDITPFILQSLISLENRGYDSSGICSIYPDIENNIQIHIQKEIFKENKKPTLLLQENLKYTSIPTNISFGHNRWATHGKKTIYNAHPHISNNLEIVLIHNGIIENFMEIKTLLLNNSFSFYSETDSEIIANLIQYLCEQNPDLPFSKILEKTIEKLIGNFALIIFYKKKPNYLFCIRRNSPLLLGYSQNYCMIVSEQSGFSIHLQKYIVLENDNICCIHHTSDDIQITMNKNPMKSFDIVPTSFLKSPDPFPYWTIREIYEQPKTIESALHQDSRIQDSIINLDTISPYSEILLQKDILILIGCGSSFHVALIGKKLASIFHPNCHFKYIFSFDGSDFKFEDIPLYGNPVVVLISQSGETKDLYNSLLMFKKNNIFTIGIINIVDSLIAREVDCSIYCNAKREIGVASTKAFTSQIVCLSLLLGWFHQSKPEHNETIPLFLNDLKDLSSSFETYIPLCHSEIKNNLSFFTGNHIFLLGKDCDEYIMKEGSLKIKEISYIHSESYSSSSLKHGPIALLDKNFPVILLHTDKTNHDKILNCYHEIISRDSKVLFLTPFDNINIPDTILLPKNSTFGFIFGIIPLQLLAYELSIQRNLNPDLPRNLAKVVSVD